MNKQDFFVKAKAEIKATNYMISMFKVASKIIEKYNNKKVTTRMQTALNKAFSEQIPSVDRKASCVLSKAYSNFILYSPSKGLYFINGIANYATMRESCIYCSTFGGNFLDSNTTIMYINKYIEKLEEDNKNRQDAMDNYDSYMQANEELRKAVEKYNKAANKYTALSVTIGKNPY